MGPRFPKPVLSSSLVNLIITGFITPLRGVYFSEWKIYSELFAWCSCLRTLMFSTAFSSKHYLQDYLFCLPYWTVFITFVFQQNWTSCWRYTILSSKSGKILMQDSLQKSNNPSWYRTLHKCNLVSIHI